MAKSVGNLDPNLVDSINKIYHGFVNVKKTTIIIFEIILFIIKIEIIGLITYYIGFFLLYLIFSNEISILINNFITLSSALISYKLLIWGLCLGIMAGSVLFDTKRGNKILRKLKLI